MATYGAWLDAQAGRGDEVGQVAKAWRDAQGRRPRASAYATIARWFEADGGDLVPGMVPDRIEAVLTASLAQYHAGNHQAGPAVPSPPLGEDLQPKRLASVPDHQQPDPAGDGETAGQDTAYPAVAGTVRPDMVFNMIGQLDERLAGLQELVAAVPAIHELLVALIKAMVPVIELAGELTASDAKLESMAGEVRDLAGQLGYSPTPEGHLVHPDSPAGRMLAADHITPAQERARSVAAQNGWMPSQAVHPMVDDARQYAAQQQAGQPADGDPGLPAGWPGSANTPPVQALYGGHIAPEPDWARYHDLGEPQ